MMSLQDQFFTLIVIVTLQPIGYGIITFLLMAYTFRVITRRLEEFGSVLGQLQLDKAGQADVQAEIEHSLDYLSREVAKQHESYAKISFLHMWVNRLDATITLLNLNISEAVDILRPNHQDTEKA